MITLRTIKIALLCDIAYPELTLGILIKANDNALTRTTVFVLFIFLNCI
jgi:hypothetical protein